MLTKNKVAAGTRRARTRIAASKDRRAAARRRLAACKVPAKIAGIYLAARTLKGLRCVAVEAKAHYANLTGSSLRRDLRAAGVEF